MRFRFTDSGFLPYALGRGPLQLDPEEIRSHFCWDPHREYIYSQETLFDGPVETSFAFSFRTIANLFAQARKSEGTEVLLQSLPTSAREELQKAVKIVCEAGWKVTGSFTQRSKKTERISLTVQNVSRLLESLS